MKLQLNDKISQCEALLERKEDLSEDKKGKEVLDLKKVEKQIENLIEEMKQELIDLEKELKSQKNKPSKYNDLKAKEKIMDLLKEKVKILKSKYNGEEIDEEEVKDNRTALEKFEDILKKKRNNEDSTQDRELSEDQINKMNEWDGRKEEQDKKIDVIAEGIQILKNEAIMAGKGIDAVGKRTKKTGKNMDNIHSRVKTQNERITELVNKIRSSDKICCDIVLILILLGLICVLYSIIKHKYIK